MKAKRILTDIRHPHSGKTYRIPYVRTFAFLALIVILLVLAALGRAAPSKIDLDKFGSSSPAIEFSSIDSPVPERAR